MSGAERFEPPGPVEPDQVGLELAVHGPVATVTLNRPQVRNAQRPAMWKALAQFGSGLRNDVRVVVVRGAGPSFSAGLDRAEFGAEPGSLLATLATAPDTVADSMIADFQGAFSWLSDPRFVSIAAVQGHAVGAGFQLALACDLILAAEDAQFRMAEVTLGLIPDLGGTGALVRAVGYQRALEICATGRPVGAAEAARIGLAVLAMPAADLETAVEDLTKAVLGSDPEAVRAVKRLLRRAAGNPIFGATGAGPFETAPQAVSPIDEVADQLAAERAEQIRLLRARYAANPA